MTATLRHGHRMLLTSPFLLSPLKQFPLFKCTIKGFRSIALWTLFIFVGHSLLLRLVLSDHICSDYMCHRSVKSEKILDLWNWDGEINWYGLCGIFRASLKRILACPSFGMPDILKKKEDQILKELAILP